MLDLQNEKLIASIFGVVFIAVAILGFIPNPIVGPTGIFVTNHAHDAVHALAGIILLTGAKMGRGKLALLGFGMVYIVVAILGYMTMGSSDMILGFVKTNMADHYLHILLGVVLIGAGMLVKGKA